MHDLHPSLIRLLVTDEVMPGGMSGRELAEKLHAEKPALRVIFTSGYSSNLFADGFEIREGDNYLTKPFQLHRLAETVRHHLDAAIP